MKRIKAVIGFLVLSIAGWFQVAPAGEDSGEFVRRIWIDAEEITFRPDGTVDETESGWVGGSVGMEFEFARDEGKGASRAAARLVPHDWGTSLLARTEFKREQGIHFHLEWRAKGKLIRTEDVISQDFAPVTRTLFVEPGTGLKHVVRFSPSLEKKGGPPPARQRVDRMRLSPGMIPGPLLRDGKMLALIPGFGPPFEKVYINVPGAGFFQFSLLPFPGSVPAGQLDGAVLSFGWRGERYQWYLGRSPLPEGAWTVFVKATDGIPPEYREAIKPEFAGEIVIGGSNGPR